MKPHREFIEVEMVILSSEEGGRATPLLGVAYQGNYRPHIVLQSREIRQPTIEVQKRQKHIVDEYLGVALWSGPDPIPISKSFTCTMLLMCAPDAIYDRVVPDTEFTIREGPKIIGHGRVLKRTEKSEVE